MTGFQIPTSWSPRHSGLIGELERFAIDPENYDPVCSYGAIRVHRRFNAGVWGYWCQDNPSCVVGRSAGGHDFAIVLDRYLVDAWAGKIEGLPIPAVTDMASKAGREIVAAWYGDPAKWMNTRKATFRETVREFNSFKRSNGRAAKLAKAGER